MPKVKERNINPLSGVTIELTHVVDRLGNTIREKQKPDFLIPLLMAGDEVSSVPVILRRFLYMEAQRQQGFDTGAFLREMWALFETRFFKAHPRLREIQELLSRRAR